MELTQPPRTRGDCENGPRPCPWVDCRHHLAMDQAMAQASNGDSPLDVSQSCALDVADLAELAGGLTLEDTGEILGVTRERVRQIEACALTSARRSAMALGIDWDRVMKVRADDLATTLDRWPGEVEPEPEPEPVKAKAKRKAAQRQPRPPKPTAPPPSLLCACGCGRPVRLRPDGMRDPRSIYARPSCSRVDRKRGTP